MRQYIPAPHERDGDEEPLLSASQFVKRVRVDPAQRTLLDMASLSFGASQAVEEYQGVLMDQQAEDSPLQQVS